MEISGYLYSALVSMISLLVYYFTVFKAGMARGRFKVDAPSHDGPPEYLRFVRAHQNTAEHLVCRLGGPYWSGLAHWSPDICPGLLSSGREAHAGTDCEHAAHLHLCAGIADRDSDATAILSYSRVLIRVGTLAVSATRLTSKI